MKPLSIVLTSIIASAGLLVGIALLVKYKIKANTTKPKTKPKVTPTTTPTPTPSTDTKVFWLYKDITAKRYTLADIVEIPTTWTDPKNIKFVATGKTQMFLNGIRIGVVVNDTEGTDYVIAEKQLGDNTVYYRVKIKDIQLT